MFRTLLAVAMTLLPALAGAQSASAPLVVTATVVSSCSVSVPSSAETSGLSTLPVVLACAKRTGASARVQRPQQPRRTEVSTDLVVIDF